MRPRSSVRASSHRLAAERVSKRFGGDVVLRDVSLAVNPGSRVGVVGRNGIGKSTLLRLLAGLERPDAGRVIRSPEDRYIADSLPLTVRSAPT